MLAKTGLLIVSNPLQVNRVLSCVKNDVKNTLYVQLMSTLGEPACQFLPSLYKFSQTIKKIYTQAAYECNNLDVRVLLSSLKDCNVQDIKTLNPIDVVIFDKKYDDLEIESFVKAHVNNASANCSVRTIETGRAVESPVEGAEGKLYKHVVLGGTFDRLHAAHKLLLSETALRSSEKITIGVTEENMLLSKTLWELIEPLPVRMKAVEDFLADICPNLLINVVPIADPFGPTQHDPTMELLVVSAETLNGGRKVNEIREGKGLRPLDVLSVELIDEPFRGENEETKMSSSTARMRLLGTLMKPVRARLPAKPYIIGFTGGIASGKSSICAKLKELGAEVINCDQVAHGLYTPGKDCYKRIVTEFGDQVLSENGEINRRVLGGIVFNDPKQMEKLNSILWPEIANEAKKIIESTKAGVVVLDAAVLLSAGWQDFCHEVWCTMIPKDEAVRRLKDRNNLSETDALARINSQPENKFYVSNAHVIFCSLWEKEYTAGQVEKAWKLLGERLPL